MRSALSILVAVALLPQVLAQRGVVHTRSFQERLGRELLAHVWVDDLCALKAALGRGADVNYLGVAHDPRDGTIVRARTTALILTSEIGDLKMARLLLAHGASPNLRDDEGNTALHQAVDEGNVAVARLLLQRGADYRIRNRFDNTPLDLTGRPDQPASFEASRAIARLIRARAARDRRAGRWRTRRRHLYT